MRDRVVLLGYRLGWRFVGLLPEPLAYGLFTLIADWVWWRRGKSVRRLESNLRRAAPERDDDGIRALARAGMRSYLRYWCDSFRLPGWSRERTVATVRVVDEHLLRTAHGRGAGLVVALAHHGNWDHAGAWSTYELAKVTTVAERLRPEELFDAFVAYRERLGMEILPLTGAGSVFTTLARRVKDGGFVPLLIDRDLTGAGIGVDFLGEKARMATGPALLALTTGAPLLPVNTHYERLPPGSPSRWGLVLTMHPPVPSPASGTRAEQVAAMTQACADALSTGIREHPADWHMLQRVFEADLAT